MKITEFSVCGQNVKIYVDGEFWAEIPYIIAFDFRLQKGVEIDDSVLLSVEQKANEKAAFDYSLWYLSRYVSTTKKLVNKLYEKQYKKAVIDNVIARLTELKYLDDYSFAENLVAKKSNKLGKRRLQAELKSKGINSDIIEQVLSTIDSEDAFDSAMAVAQKWYRTHELETLQDSQKFLRFMAYRGFDYDTINRCREVLKVEKNN